MIQARHDQAAIESAVARLLAESLLMIRYLAAPGRQLASADESAGWRRQVHALADLCHNLPGLLDPGGRDRIHEGVAYLWRTASTAKRDWIRQCWDAAGYDYRWLAAPREDEPGEESARAWSRDDGDGNAG